MNSPCHGCRTRSPTCHGQCEAYAVFDAERQKIRLIRYANRIDNGVHFDRICRALKQIHLSKRR